MRAFAVEIGENDVRGHFDVNFRDRPKIRGTVRSVNLDLSERLKQATDVADQVTEESEDGLVFPDEPIRLEGLQAADVDIRVRIDRLQANRFNVSDLNAGVRLLGGALTVEPFGFKDRDGGLEARVNVRPQDSGYAVDLAADSDNVHLGTLMEGRTDRSVLPPVSGRLELTGAGASIHEIMASSSGHVSLRQGSGRISNRGALLFGDLVTEVLRTLNPMRSKDDEYRVLECGIYEIVIDDGIADLKDFVMQTDRLTMLASGKVWFETGKVDVVVRAKSREGIGISVGGVINSFLKVGGTLASPELALDAKGAAKTTGVAVLTGGFSLVAKGLSDRLSAAADICNPAQGDAAQAPEDR